MIFSKLHKNECGSAMTEFVIGLPIFLIIFSGMGTIYRISDSGLRNMAGANSDLWVQAQDSKLSAAAVIPATAALTVTSIKGLFTTGSQAGGIYLDSYAKVGLASAIVPGAPGNRKVVPKITQIDPGFLSKAPSTHLLNDLYDIKGSANFKGFGGFLSRFIRGTGSGLAIATGIRYGSVNAKKSSSVNTAAGPFDLESNELSLPFNTAATHRLSALALIRLEHSQNEVTNKSILNFTGSFSKINTDGPPDWGSPGSGSKKPSKCSKQKKTYQMCRKSKIENYRDTVKSCESANGCASSEKNGKLCSACSHTQWEVSDADKACKSKKPASSCKGAAAGTKLDVRMCKFINTPDCSLKLGN